MTSPENGRSLDDFVAVSAFAGIGGFDLALRHCGVETAVQIEIDPNCQSVLRRHFPKAKQLGDIRHAQKEEFGSAITLFCGGSPCQSFSVAGNRAGFDGESQLWYEFHRLLVELRPRYFCWENVPGVLSSGPLDPITGKRRKGIDFAVILAGFTGIVPTIPESGWRNSGIAPGHFYNVAWRCFDSQYTGVPQRRRRIFAVGCLAGTGLDPSQILFEFEGGAWHPPTRPKARKTSAAGAQTHSDGNSLPERSADSAREKQADLLVESGLMVSGTLSGSGAASARTAGNVNETDLIIPTVATRRSQRSDSYAPSDIATPLMARDFKSGRDLVTVDAPLSIDLQQVTSKANRVTPSLEAPPLTPKGRPVAFGLSNELNAGEEFMPTLTKDTPTGGGHPPMVFTQNQPEATRDLEGVIGVSESIKPEVKAYNVTFCDSNGLRQDRPNGGLYVNETDQANTLQAGNPSEKTVIAVHSGDGSDTSPALTAGSRGVGEDGSGRHAFAVAPTGVRRLTPVECERLQGFPENWTAYDDQGNPISDSVRYRMCGNAVTVTAVEWIIRRIIETERDHRAKQAQK